MSSWSYECVELVHCPSPFTISSYIYRGFWEYNPYKCRLHCPFFAGRPFTYMLELYTDAKSMVNRVLLLVNPYEWLIINNICSVNPSIGQTRKCKHRGEDTSVRLQNLPWYKTGLVSRQVLHWPKTGQYKACLVSNTKIEASIRANKPKPWQSHITSERVEIFI